MMKLQKITFFLLALVVAGSVAHDPTTAPDEPCTTEGDAVDKCVSDNKCTASCPTDFFTTGGSQSTAGGEFNPPSDLSDMDALKASFQKFMTGICDASKVDVCVAKECCTACQTQMEAALSCFTAAFPLMMEQSIADADADSNSAVSEANSLAQDGMNSTETLVPTMDSGFLLEGWTCDLADIACASGSSSSGSSSPGSTPAPGGSKPPSSANHISYVLAAVAAAAVMIVI